NWKDMQQRNIGYVLMGPVGTGKSFFAGCIANALMEQGIAVMMTNFSRILNELTKPYADKNEFISHLVYYPLLIIDDLGIERNSEFALEMIYNIIDRRYCIKKPLIVTTNLSYQDMTRTDLDMDHQRIYSRLMEMCLPIIYQGQDQRLHEQDIKLEWLKLQQE
ncbi:MAG: ATP-binding protein, partial [Firmicutes bacterium]|nr:ATP-binding protein [Bacillota bacterium]